MKSQIAFTSMKYNFEYIKPFYLGFFVCLWFFFFWIQNMNSKDVSTCIHMNNLVQINEFEANLPVISTYCALIHTKEL